MHLPQANGSASVHRTLVLLIAYLGFVSLGLPDTLIGVAWPSVREHFGLSQKSVALVFIASGASYFLSSFFAGTVIRRFRIGMVLAASCFLVALSGAIFGLAPIWILFVLG